MWNIKILYILHSDTSTYIGFDLDIYLFGIPLDLLQHPASFCSTLLQLFVAVLDSHDQVVNDITVFLPAELCESTSCVLHGVLHLAVIIHLTQQFLYKFSFVS